MPKAVRTDRLTLRPRFGSQILSKKFRAIQTRNTPAGCAAPNWGAGV
jgi:hypothetical protein